ncbi:Rieske 2Fe-2S domain-containing protein [Litorimonas sp.]|uniref:Rieske 2Fe-2S domain-containing protein n=1 Tax=Litorimonas sp. TaxID=1892381 RepID=UPI003A8BD202
MQKRNTDPWHPIALSEQISSESPIRVCTEQDEIALFRDSGSVVRALEDRCPHRRVPLSLGKVINGDLRCAYHGWTFNGANGNCTQIPNLSADESVPKRYKVAGFDVREVDGFVYLRKTSQPQSVGDCGPHSDIETQLPLFGSLIIPFDTLAYQLAMIDGPETLFGIHNVGFTDFFLGDPVWREGRFISDRAAGWTVKGKAPSKWDRDYPFILRTVFNSHNGMITHHLLDPEDKVVAEVHLGIFSGPRQTTNVVWRGTVHPDHGYSRKILRSKSPIAVFDRLDGAAIASLLTGPSLQMRKAG